MAPNFISGYKKYFGFQILRYLLSSSNPGNDKGVIHLSARMRMYEDLVEHGVVDVLKREYGDSFQETPEVSSSVCSFRSQFIFLIFKVNWVDDACLYS